MNLLRLVPRKQLPFNHWGDREFSRRRFVRKHGRPPNPCNPVRLSDHFYRIKTNGSLLDPLCQLVTDKEFVKLYIANTVGQDHVLETYEILRNAKDIAAFVPAHVPCVVKPTHLSGRVMFHTDPNETIDPDLLVTWLNTEWYKGTREANYRYLRPKIIVEEFFSQNDRSVPKDYKLFCFHGVPKLIQVDDGRFCHHTRNFYDMCWNRLPMTYSYQAGPDDEKPPRLQEMSEIASMLAAQFSFVRVDLYANQTQVCVGELTLCPQGANEPIFPAAADIELANLFESNYRLDANLCAKAWANHTTTVLHRF